MFTILHKHRKSYMITTSLFLLSTADAIFTDIGLRQAVITELNPIMNSIYDTSIFLFYFIKIVLPLALIFCAPYAFSSRIVKRTLTCAIVIYFGVFVYHIGWSTYVFFLFS
ncbi:hypothetical protein BTR23_00245 [Alkalihalophilus pseudofirmus]|uniref:DUF5658 family protein n=1 Tax=Alkalihalobacterium alkalinitrilicum TaxID=427920 RepID=UPI00094DA366|nr:DUF5658 family protein [Alkalihalobacterium alkalinitrilicum]OLO42486.1 hypothetical protein BTR23_00245 [Alkalihalophilus pseudofirmus]